MSVARGLWGFLFAMLAPLTTAAASDEPGGAASAPASDEAGTRREVPIVAYAYAAHGTEAKTIGVHAYALGLAASGQDGVVGGGGAIWGSPVRRLTLVVDGQRNLSREFSPSAAAIVNLYGDGGFSLGALGKFKIDGFAGGTSRDEVESEAEIGALLSYRGARWYLDANAIAGRGMGDEGEMDAEGRLRFGHDLGSHFRLGFDGQVRARAAGPRYLPNGRTWDFAAGPQAMLASDRFYGSVTAGPATTGLVSRNVGWIAMLSVGAVAF